MMKKTEGAKITLRDQAGETVAIMWGHGGDLVMLDENGRNCAYDNTMSRRKSLRAPQSRRDLVVMSDSTGMGDTSPKNIHKQAEQKHEAKAEKEHVKQANAEVQHHPHSGHPPTDEELEHPEIAEKDPEVI